MTDETPATTGRRVWTLTWRLALPWVVCGGLLWALVGLTPEPFPANLLRTADLPAGAASGFVEMDAWPGHPLALVAIWNVRAFQESNTISPPLGPEELVRRIHPQAGVAWTYGAVKGERLAGVQLSLWWLLPTPLLWSVFNLWRWVRRGEAA